MTDDLNIKDEEVVEPEVVEETEKKGFFKRKCDCDKLKEEIEEYKYGWQRAVADYKNLQKETVERRQEWVNMSELQILEDFIPVYDHFKMAFRLRTTDYSSEQQKWIDGIGYIMKQFSEVMRAHGVEEMKVVGEKFDPKYHEAMGEEDSDKDSGTILREVDAGYVMKGKVIKAAKVILAK